MRIGALITLVAMASAGTELSAENDEVLPEGNTGIAARYPGDEGIGGDAAVLFADDFEGHSTVSGMQSTWEVLVNSANLSLVRDAGKVHDGDQALQLRVEQRDSPMSTGVLLAGTSYRVW